MGRYSKAIERTETGAFIQLRSGVGKRVRIIDDPYVQNTSYKDPKTGEWGAPRTQYAWLVWDYEQQKIRILKKGASVLKAVDEIITAWNIQNMPMNCDVVITATGEGLNTRYSVQGVPLDPGLVEYNPNAEKPNISKLLEGAIHISEFADGKDPHTQQIEAGSDSVNTDEYVPDQVPIEAYGEEIHEDSVPDFAVDQPPAPAPETPKEPAADKVLVDSVIESLDVLRLPKVEEMRMMKDCCGVVTRSALYHLPESVLIVLAEAISAKEAEAES